MSIFGRIEKRAYPSGTKAIWDQDVERSTRAQASGVDVDPNTARMLAAVWACQSLIADGVASLPLDVYREEVSSGRRFSVSTPGFLKSPNPFESPYTFWHKVMVSLLGEDGNAFILTPRDSKGQVVSIWALDPRIVDVDELSPIPIYRVNGEEKTTQELLHIPAFVRPGHRRGLSVIDHAREAIGLGLAAEEFGARFFSQGTTMAGVVEHPGTPKPGEVAVLAKMLKKTHAGIKNSHAVGVLTGGATWKSISITPEQAQFLETRRFQKLEIASLYRVPPHLLDPTVQSSWGSGVEEQNKFFVDYTLIPWLTRLEQAFSGLLPNGQYVKFNADARLRAKTAERFAAYVQAANNGIMSLDEIRDLEDMEPIPDGRGTKFYVPANLQELGTQPAAPPAPSGAQPTSDGPQANRHLPGKHNQQSHGNWKLKHPEHGAPGIDVNAGFGAYRHDDTYRKIPTAPIRKTKTEVPPPRYQSIPQQPPMTHAKGAHVFGSEADREAFWSARYDKWAAHGLPEDEADIHAYTSENIGDSYKPWNKSLRSGTGHATARSENAAASLRTGYVDEDVIVYRGAHSGSWSTGLKPGGFFHEKGFTSTSADHSATFEGDIMMRVRVPKGARAAYVDPISSFGGEREVVMPAGSTYKVHAITEANGKMYVDVTLTHQGTRPEPKPAG